MASPSDASAALAAAVAAAAEIAKNNVMNLLDDTNVKEVGSTPSNTPMTDEKRDSSKDDENVEDAEKRLARSRERNREHARRTRLRKKAHLEALQAKVELLQQEGRTLKQNIEECSIASILVGLSGGNNTQHATDSLLEDAKSTSQETPQLVSMAGKRKRFISESSITPQPLKITIEGQTALIGVGKTHINWKSGVYCDENGVQRQLTQEQLESLRRERNRMHAKMTRDRKKCFISAVEKTIQQLEEENKRMRDVLGKVADMVGSQAVTPVDSPVLQSTPPPMNIGPSVTPEIQEDEAPFSLSTA